MKQSLLILFFLSTSFGLNALTWGILPVRFNSMPQTTPPETSVDLAKAMHLYLEMTGMKNLVSPSAIAGAYQAIQATPQGKITKTMAQSIANYADADRLLVTQISHRGGQYQIETHVFYVETSSVTDTITTSGGNLMQAIGEHLHRRFSSLVPLNDTADRLPSLVVITEASGGNYAEINQLSREVPLLSVSQSAVCVIDADGNLKTQPLSLGMSHTSAFLSSLTKRGRNTANHLSTAASCAAEIARKTKLNKAIFVFLTSEAPSDTSEASRLKGHLRSLSKYGRILILGSGHLSTQARDYYENLANDFGGNDKGIYRDVLYRQQVGLASGESWFIFKRGVSLLESQNSNASDATPVNVPTQKRDKFLPDTLEKTYTELSQNKVLSRGKVQIIMTPSLQSMMGSLQTTTSVTANKNTARVFLQMPGGSFWLSLPMNQVKVGMNISVAVNLARPSQGIPLVNSPQSAKVFNNGSDIPKMLLLPLTEYLKNPNKFMGKSIGGSSIYILQGKVLDIRATQKDILD